MFPLAEHCARPKVHSASLPASNGDLPLSQEIDWQTHPYHRLCHYEPAVLALYLREILQVMPPEFQIAYLGDHLPSLEQVRKVWVQMHPTNSPVLHLAETSSSVAPDVLLVGEMRDLDTISAAITIAETGHLVLATLHTNDTTQAVDRMVDVFPGDQQQQVRVQLSNTLAAVIFEELAKRHENGRAPLGLDRPWESRSHGTHEVWGAAVRKALSRTGLSDENPGADGFCLYLPRKSGASPLLVYQVMALKREADRKAAENTSSPTPSLSEAQQHLPQPPQQQQPKRPWWKFW